MQSVIWDQRLALIDDLVKKGKKAEVLIQITELLEQKPPEDIKPKVARLANRSGYSQLGLKILFKQVRDSKIGIKKISSEAISVYAQSLLNIGALDESESLLNTITDRPEIELQKAFICFARWDYQKAIPHLKKYIGQRELTDYQKLVGRVNFIAALVSVGQLKRALKELIQVEKKLILQKAELLLGNVNELKAQIFIYQKKFDHAQIAITLSLEYLKSFPGRYSLYARKWKAVINFYLHKQSQQLTEELLQIRNEALPARDWETVRDCDFQLAFLKKNRSALDRIYLGTPHPGFRKRLRDLYLLKAPKTKRLKYISEGLNKEVPAAEASNVGLDLSNNLQMSEFSKYELTLLQTLLKDIYKPPRIGEVFASLYPTEFFDPFSSGQRVKNVVHRTNRVLSRINRRLQIRIVKGYFQLQSDQAIKVVFNQNQLFWPHEKFQLGLLHKLVQSRSFTFEDVNKSFANQHAFQKLANWGLQNRKIVKISQTKPVRYRFCQLKLKPEE